MNAAWRNVKGRMTISAEYKAWMNGALLQLGPQPSLKGPCYWSARVAYPGTTGVDLDNLSKGLFDALHKAEKTPDDRYLCGMSACFWAHDYVGIWVAKESATEWGHIRGASKALIKKLEG